MGGVSGGQSFGADLCSLLNGDVVELNCEWKMALARYAVMDANCLSPTRLSSLTYEQLKLIVVAMLDHCSYLSARFGSSCFLEEPHKLLAQLVRELLKLGELPEELDTLVRDITASSKRRYKRSITTNDHERTHEVPDAYLIRDFVLVHGLQKRHELNGARGRVVSRDREKGRYGVAILSDDGRPEIVSVHGSNLVASESV